MDSQNHEQSMAGVNDDSNNMTRMDSSNNTNSSVQTGVVSHSDGNHQMGQMYNIVSSEANNSVMSPSAMSMTSTMSSTMSRGRSKVWNEFSITGDGKKVILFSPCNDTKL
jgi:hypothetical protein